MGLAWSDEKSMAYRAGCKRRGWPKRHCGFCRSSSVRARPAGLSHGPHPLGFGMDRAVAGREDPPVLGGACARGQDVRGGLAASSGTPSSCPDRSLALRREGLDPALSGRLSRAQIRPQAGVASVSQESPRCIRVTCER